MNFPYPNRAQWVVIWVTVLAASHVWLQLRLSDWIPGGGPWGMDGYLAPALYRHPSRLALSLLVIGVLLVWQLSRWHFRRWQLVIPLGVVVCCACLYYIDAENFLTAPTATVDEFMEHQGQVAEHVRDRQVALAVATAGVLLALLPVMYLTGRELLARNRRRKTD